MAHAELGLSMKSHLEKTSLDKLCPDVTLLTAAGRSPHTGTITVEGTPLVGVPCGEFGVHELGRTHKVGVVTVENHYVLESSEFGYMSGSEYGSFSFYHWGLIFRMSVISCKLFNISFFIKKEIAK